MTQHPQFEYQAEDMTVNIEPRQHLVPEVKNVLHPPPLFQYEPEVRERVRER